MSASETPAGTLDFSTRELDPRLLEAVRKLSFLPHLLSSDSYSGIHDGKRSGSNMEFSTHRQYEPGDDLRYLDWNILAKTGEAHLKQFESENRISAGIFMDSSNSMDYASENLSKWELARAVAVLCGGILLQQGDRVKFIASGNNTVELPDWSSPEQLSAKLEDIKKISPGGETSLLRAAKNYEKRVKKKKLWIFISDFWLPDRETFFQWIKNIQSRGHRVLLVATYDPLERHFDSKNPCRLRDKETGATVTLSPAETDKFTEKLRSARKQLKNMAVKNNTTLWSFFTDSNPIKRLHDLLAESSLNR